MATTLTFLCLHTGGAMVAHIGDSRIYQIRPGAGILYRSFDHSLVNAMVHSGDITPDEAENHPKSNYITRSMNPGNAGQARSCASVLQITDVQAGDYFLLCTDGVLHCCDDNTLLEILSSEMPDEMKMRDLARKCYFSSDNNTAILVGIKEVVTDEQETDAQDEAEWTKTKTIDPKDRCPEIVEVESIRPKRGSLLKRLFYAVFN
jgi:protein phosphatase